MGKPYVPTKSYTTCGVILTDEKGNEIETKCMMDNMGFILTKEQLYALFNSVIDFYEGEGEEEAKRFIKKFNKNRSEELDREMRG